MATVPGDFVLTVNELRVVTRYVAESAQQVLPVFVHVHPDDPRPRAAVDAAWAFVDGASRSRLQRTTSMDAHRAASQASTETARLAARCAGDAASAAYLHPVARAHQVGHILRAAASAAPIAELDSGDPTAGDDAIDEARRRATPVLVDVLGPYPPAAGGGGRVAELTHALDTVLRACS